MASAYVKVANATWEMQIKLETHNSNVCLEMVFMALAVSLKLQFK